MIDFDAFKKCAQEKFNRLSFDVDKKNVALFVAICISLVSFIGCPYVYSNLYKARVGYINVYTVSASPKIKAVDEENNKAMIKLAEEVYAKTSDLPEDSLDEINKLKNEFDKKSKEIQIRKITERNKLLRDAADKVRKEKNLSAVLGINVVLSGGVDVTEDVVKQLQ